MHPLVRSRVLSYDAGNPLQDFSTSPLGNFAAGCVGTAAGADVERLRAQRLFDWADAIARPRWPRTIVRRLKRRSLEKREASAAARYAIQSIGRLSDELHAEVLALVDGLIRASAADLFGKSVDSATVVKRPVVSAEVDRV